MGIVKTVDKLESYLHESMIISDIMVDFPTISKEDNLAFLVNFVTKHFQETGEIINLNSIPDTMVGAPLKVARKRKSKKYASEVVDEPKPKKQKQSEKEPKLDVVVKPSLPTIQEEVNDMEPAKILSKRTRCEASNATSSQLKLKVPKKKRGIRKMKVSYYVLQEDAEVEASSDLISRVERRKKANDDHESSLLE